MRWKPSSLADLATSLIVPCCLVWFWEAGSRSGALPGEIIASPSAVVAKSIEMLGDGTLVSHATVSLKRLAMGFGLGAAIGILSGVIVGASRRARLLFGPTIAVLAPVPVTAWIPLLIVMVGIGEESKIAILAVGTFFPVFFAAVAGMASSGNELVELARVYRKSRRQVILLVHLPAAAPYIFHGMKTALGLCWVLLVVAEVIASQEGLGWVMQDARSFGRPAEMIVAVAASGVLGALTIALLAQAERRLVYWTARPSAGASA